MQPASYPVDRREPHAGGPPPSADALRYRIVAGDLSQTLGELDEVRHKALRSVVLAAISGCIPLLLVYVLAAIARSCAGDVSTLDPAWIAAPFAGLVAFLVLCGFFVVRYFRLRQLFRRGFKDAVYPEAIRLLDPSFEYTREAGISLARFKEGRMFLHKVDGYGSEDHVRGMHGATAFEFAEVRASYETRDSDGDRVDRPVFGGLYFIADFNKHFKTRTVVVPARGESLGALTKLRDAFGFARGKIVSLEDPEFARAFVVYAEDDIEVRYLLSPALMRRILDFNGKVGGWVSLSFLRGELHVAVSRSGELFEPSLTRSAFSLGHVDRYLAQVRGILAIIDDLNLNTRIWTKR